MISCSGNAQSHVTRMTDYVSHLPTFHAMIKIFEEINPRARNEWCWSFQQKRSVWLCFLDNFNMWVSIFNIFSLIRIIDKFFLPLSLSLSLMKTLNNLSEPFHKKGSHKSWMCRESRDKVSQSWEWKAFIIVIEHFRENSRFSSLNFTWDFLFMEPIEKGTFSWNFAMFAHRWIRYWNRLTSEQYE